MRTFLAIEIDAAIRGKIQAIRQRLRKANGDIKWVEEDNTHLTIKFIGEIDAERLPELTAAIEQCAAASRGFEIAVRGVGTFPARRPRVLWVGAEDASGTLAGLHRAVDAALSRFGVDEEGREFSGHLTLGRVRSGKNLDKLVAALEAEAPADLGVTKVESLVLFESKLMPQGPRYSALARIPLAGS